MDESSRKNPNPLMMLNIIHRMRRKKSRKPLHMSPAKSVLRKQHLEISNFFKEKSHSVSRRIKVSQTNSVNNLRKDKLGNLFNFNSRTYITSIAHSKENNILPKIRTPAVFNSKIKQSRTQQHRKKKKINITVNKPKVVKRESRIDYDMIENRAQNKITARKHSLITSSYPEFLSKMYRVNETYFNKYPI